MPEKIRIAFDTWTLGSFARNQGIYVYARHLLTQFHQIAYENSIEVLPYVCAGAENDASAFSSAPGFSPAPARLLQSSRIWRYGGAWATAWRRRPDIVFSPHVNCFYAGNRPPAVITIHDLIPLKVSWPSKRVMQTLRFLSWSAAKFSRAIITVSEHSKKDLMETYGVPESKVSVVFQGFDKKIFNSAPPGPEQQKELLGRLEVDKPYILHHGAIQPRKNLKRLIEAWRLVLSRNRNLDVDLVLAGPLGLDNEEIVAAAQARESRGRVVLTGPLSDADLGILVKGATLEVIPSLYEGFSLPMVEAMACGTPTVVANASCLPEISGGVLRYFDPYSKDEMATCIEDVLENEELRRELAENGQKRAARFDWRICAEQTLTVLKRVAESESGSRLGKLQ
jgi:glycosyltransferase involved in cell wall biosynthesis